MPELTPSYMENLRRFHDNHPDAAAAEHRAFLGGLGLSEAAQREIVGRNAPELAHHPQIGQIGARPKSEHAQAVADLHEREQAGPDGDSNARTDAYLQKRGKLSTHHRRAGLRRA